MSDRPRDDLTGHTAIISGAGSGIGAATAVRLAFRGATVAVLDIRGDAARQVAQGLACEGIAIECDMGDAEQVVRCVDHVVEATGGIDILVNNAALGSHTSPWDMTLAEWNRVLAVSLTGYFVAAQAAARSMAQRGGGAIVNVSSVAGHSALGRGNLAYSVAKGGVNQLTRELAVEWASAHIRVNAVAPCQVETPSLNALLSDPTLDDGNVAPRFLGGIPAGRLAKPDDIATAIEFLTGDGAAMITGIVLPVDGGNTALNPGGTIGAWPRTELVVPG